MASSPSRRYVILVLLLLSQLANAEAGSAKIPLLDGMGTHHHPITTDVPETQRYFDQGLVLSYGFNHAAAKASFEQAARLDPDCAMCYWGIALVLGPNINNPMDPAAESPALAAIQQAQKLAAGGSDKERAYIAALAHRYGPPDPGQRQARDQAYADAMRKLAGQYPDDNDAQTLFAEALMDLHPWDYWEQNQPRPWTPELMEILERVLANNPDHPGANHFYIHVVEASPTPEKGEAAAQRLRTLVPGAGHLVHMPAHIFIRLGRYHEASQTNQNAIAADQKFLSQVDAEGIYPLGYVPHNYHFLWATLSLEGRSAEAIKTAQATADLTPPGLRYHQDDALFEHFTLLPLYALVTFGRWQEILARPEPDPALIYSRSIWHYARGMALLRTGQAAQGQAALDALQALLPDVQAASRKIWGVNTTGDLVAIAANVLAGELAAEQQQWQAAIDYLVAAKNAEDLLIYIEPPDWFPPVRLMLGRVLLAANKPVLAESIYRQLLAKFPNNGWALLGLQQSLQAQGKTDQAKALQPRFDKAWQHADFKLNASSL